MTAIVLNTSNLAVTEWDLDFQSLTATHAGSATGLFELGGQADLDQPIAARAITPITDMGSALRKNPGDVYLSIQGPRGSEGNVLVQSMTVDDQDQEVIEEFEYPCVIRPSNMARATPGKGIRANRLAIGYANVDGADFRLDKLEADVIESKSGRRLA